MRQLTSFSHVKVISNYLLPLITDYSFIQYSFLESNNDDECLRPRVIFKLCPCRANSHPNGQKTDRLAVFGKPPYWVPKAPE